MRKVTQQYPCNGCHYDAGAFAEKGSRRVVGDAGSPQSRIYHNAVSVQQKVSHKPCQHEGKSLLSRLGK